MDFMNINVPFLGNLIIKNKADLFRKTFWDNSIPVEIEDIIDLKLRLDIVPTKDLLRQCDTDALITSNWNLIYVDHDKFMDERYKNRLRFSFAHEIGHFILHKIIYRNFGIKGIRNYYESLEKIPQEQYGYLETQANKFANYLLIPRDALIVQKNQFIKKNKKVESLIISKKIDSKTVNSYLAMPLAKIFGVSEEAMEIALNEINSGAI